ncbi:MAG: NUDIX hydrolase, partial [Planctomycetota bacterium]
PFKGQWAVPGGFLELDEELEDGVARELAEETGLTGVQLEQIRAFGKCGRDPRGRQISIVFMGVASEQQQAATKAGDDAAKAKWFDIENLPDNLAFDHDEMIKFAVKRLEELQK